MVDHEEVLTGGNVACEVVRVRRGIDGADHRDVRLRRETLAAAWVVAPAVEELDQHLGDSVVGEDPLYVPALSPPPSVKRGLYETQESMSIDAFFEHRALANSSAKSRCRSG